MKIFYYTLLWNDCLCDTIDGLIVAGAVGFGVGFGWIGTGVDIIGGVWVVWIVGIELICNICCCKLLGTWTVCCSFKCENNEPTNIVFHFFFEFKF